MKKTMLAGIGVAVVALATGVWWYVGMSDDPGEGWRQGSTKQVSSEKKTVPENTIVMDVRTPEEFATGHALRAVNLPLDKISAENLPMQHKDTPIYVYCRSGNRSAQAKMLLEQRYGFKNVVDIGAFSNIEKYGLEQAKL